MTTIARCLLVLALAAPFSAVAQAPRVTVTGRVVEAGTTLGIPFAAVELEGHGRTLADEDGSFRFQDVEPGAYTLWVASFGYAAVSTFIRVDRDMEVTTALQPAPIPLDPLVATRIELKGRVRDAKNDISLIDADILSNKGWTTETDTHGRFKVKGVFEGFPLRLRVQSFGYLPVDTVLVPERGKDYLFDLVPDSAVEAQIAVFTAHMQEKAAPFFSVGFRNMNRDRLLEFAGAHTMRSVIEFETSTRFARRVRRVLVDGKTWSFTKDPLAELNFILPEEAERTEFLDCGRGCVVVSIYTRDYMRDLLARQAELPNCTVIPALVYGLSAQFDRDPQPQVLC